MSDNTLRLKRLADRCSSCGHTFWYHVGLAHYCMKEDRRTFDGLCNCHGWESADD